MTADEIYELARNKQPMPTGVNLSEQMLFSTARNIYKAYETGAITMEQAKQEKLQSVKLFEQNTLSERVYTDHMRRMTVISRALSDAEKNGCEHCRRLASVFDGRHWK